MDFETMIKSLNEIQENLAGIIIPVIVTSAISVLTLLTDVIEKIVIYLKNKRDKRYNEAKDIYTLFRSKCCEIINVYNNIRKNDHFSSKDKFNILLYINKNWDQYRKNLPSNKMLTSHEFEKSILCLNNLLVETYEILNDNFVVLNILCKRKKLSEFLNYLSIINYNTKNKIIYDKTKNSNIRIFDLNKLNKIIKKMDKKI